MFQLPETEPDFFQRNSLLLLCGSSTKKQTPELAFAHTLVVSRLWDDMKRKGAVFMKESCAASSWKDCPFPTLAAAFIPPQTWEDLYAPEVALNRGTLFAQLDKPFIGERDDQ